MEARELRIGNWINDMVSQPYAVSSYHINQLSQSEAKGKINIDFNPIPLTEEWLVKFGLTDKNESDIGTAFYFPHRANRHWLNEHLQISVFHSKFNHKDDEYFNMMLAEIHLGDFEYVHQLQNLYFALTGEEL